MGYLVPDLHGSVVATEAAGSSAIASALRYDGYGRTAAVALPGGTVALDTRYTGALDLSPDSTPLYDIGARFYSPASGAWTSLDTYGGQAQDPASMNRFLYAHANPTTFIDPSGHAPCKPGKKCAHGGGVVSTIDDDGPSTTIAGGGGNTGGGAQPPKGPISTVPTIREYLDNLDDNELLTYVNDWAKWAGRAPTILDFDYMYAKCRAAQLSASDCLDYARQKDWSDLDGPLGTLAVAPAAAFLIGAAPWLAATSPWTLNWIDRGRETGRRLGENLPGNYPTFDRYANGVATSIKSVDLTARTYQTGNALERLLTSYVDKAASGVLRNWGEARLAAQPITQRVLDVAIPNVTPIATQQEVLARVVAYGQANGVTVNFVVVP